MYRRICSVLITGLLVLAFVVVGCSSGDSSRPETLAACDDFLRRALISAPYANVDAGQFAVDGVRRLQPDDCGQDDWMPRVVSMELDDTGGLDVMFADAGEGGTLPGNGAQR